MHMLYTETGFVEPKTSMRQDQLVTPQRLQWNIPVPLEHAIERAVAFSQKVG